MKKIIGYTFTPYITKNGVRIYPRNGKVFRIPIYAQE